MRCRPHPTRTTVHAYSFFILASMMVVVDCALRPTLGGLVDCACCLSLHRRFGGRARAKEPHNKTLAVFRRRGRSGLAFRSGGPRKPERKTGGPPAVICRTTRRKGCAGE